MLHQKLAESEGGAAERAELLELVGLADAGGRRIGTMSKGMQQRLGLAQALIGSPRMLLLDEPTSALDPAGRRTVRALLEELRGRGVSVLLNSHLLSEVELVCDRVAIIARGAVVAAGTPAELAHAGGVEVETASGPRVIRRGAARGRAADRARAGGGGRGGLRRARVDLDARRRISGSGGGRRRPMNQVRVIAAFTLRESLRRRVFLVVALLTLAFLGALRARHLAAVRRSSTRTSSTRPAWSSGSWRARRCSGWRCSRRSSSAPCSPSSSRSAPSAATPSAGCCSRCSCGRSRAAPCCSAATPRPRPCAPRYVIAVFLAAAVITWITGGWWPDRIVVPALGLAFAVAIIAALSLARLGVPVGDRQRDRGVHGLRGGPGRRAARPDRRGARLRHAAERRQGLELAAAVRGPLSGRAARA